MATRTALLIRCSEEDASRIRQQAGMERRTVSNYVLNIVLRAAVIEQRLMVSSQFRLSTTRYFVRIREAGPRTAILLRCSATEGKTVRAAAEIAGIPISSYVLHCLRRAWNVTRKLQPDITEKA